MYEAKTNPTEKDVLAFIEAIEKDQKREDSLQLLQLFEEVTGYPAKLWGTSIIGFDSYHYKYASGHEGEATRVGFAPGKSNQISLYLLFYESEKQEELLARLGKHKRGKSCLYINKLADVDINVLRELIQFSWDEMNRLYPKE